VTPGPVREDKYSVASVRVGGPARKNVGDLGLIPGRDVGATTGGPGNAPVGGEGVRPNVPQAQPWGGQANGDPVGHVHPDNVKAAPPDYFAALESIREKLQKEPELVILFNDAIKGDDVRRLVEFGESLGIPVKYVALVDYSNSRGAIDMGLTPGADGMRLDAMIAAGLDVLWVVGANPLEGGGERKAGFMVAQDMFLTETARQADIVLPAANAYEKDGTVTNVTGEVQRLKKAINTIGAKPDLEIMGFIAREMGAAAALGPWSPRIVFEEIRRNVHGYAIPLPPIIAGGAAQTAPVNGRVTVEDRPDLVESDHNGLFSSGTLGRYSKVLHSVVESRMSR
jgi:NADH-quinone oxidoreductase subunit G